MQEPLILYTHPMSRGRVARWMIEETGLPYEAKIIDFGAPMKSPEYLAINPMGKVPALRHGEAIVTENAAICAYLASWCPSAAWHRRKTRPSARPTCAGCSSWPGRSRPS